MRKILAALMMLAIIGITLPLTPSSSPTLAQDDDPIVLPRYADGGAIIQRPPDHADLNFTAQLTPDNHYVLGLSYWGGRELYIWDISTIGASEDVITPEPITVDLTTFASDDYYGATLLAIQSAQFAIVRVGHHLIQIDIPSQSIAQSINVEFIEPPTTPPSFGSLSVQGEMAAMLHPEVGQVTVWDTATNTQISHIIFDSVDLISPFRGGWLIQDHGLGETSTHYFCDLTLDNCIRESVAGSLGVDFNGVLVFGQFSYRPIEDRTPLSYYIFDFENGLQPTDPIFPNLPLGAIPTSISPDSQYMRVYTPYDDSPAGGGSPTHGYQIWKIDGNQPISPHLNFGSAGWFGDHFLVEATTLRTADSTASLDWLRPPFRLVHTHEGAIFRQISEDGSRVLFVNSGEGMVLPIEYQRVDDLLRVDNTIVLMETDDLHHTRLSADGQFLMGIRADQLMAWNLTSDHTTSLDLSPYLTDESVIEMLVRTDDAFLQIDSHLLRLQLSDLSITNEISVDDTLTFVPAWSDLVQEQSSIIENGDIVAALFDHTTLLWRDGEFQQANTGGMRLYPRTDGWTIFDVVITEEGRQQQISTCDLSLNDCTAYPFDETFSTLVGDNGIVGGNSILLFTDNGIQPSYWTIADTLTPTDPFIDLPENHVPADFHGDYAVVSAPSLDPFTPYQYQIWSVADHHAIPPFAFERQWLWTGDYLLYTQANLLTIVHLPDGRYTRWSPDAEYFSIQLSSDGASLLITSNEAVQVLALTQ